MDKDGYPDDQELKIIEDWPYQSGYDKLMEYVYDRWRYADCGYWCQIDSSFQISTGGWSGNESLIQAMEHNRMFWAMCWVSSRRGGQYEFEVKEIDNGNKH